MSQVWKSRSLYQLLSIKSTREKSLEKENEITNDKYIPTNKRMTNQEVDPSMKRAYATMEDSSKKQSEDKGFKNQSLLVLEQTNKYDFFCTHC